jgi:para-aminobenzoate synthetase/4-amino-4-deoxychorismate lyase
MSSDRSGIPVAHFESFAEGRGWQGSFGEPHRQRRAYSLDEVLPLLRDAETAASEGLWVALFLSYESAPAFDSALQAKTLSDFPLAWMAVFRQPISRVGPIANRQFRISNFEPAVDKAGYERAIDSIKTYIESGDTYQVNFTFPMRGNVAGDPFSCFRSIGQSQGAAYSAYLDIGSHKILSFSPELFVECRGNSLITRPMKGTLERGRWLEEDSRRCEQLKESAKDRAENVMIVDLLRSDLGKVAEIGSVAVPELFAVERLSRVLQMTSTVTAVRRPDANLVDVLQALFPCGSITGAPKPRTMAIINQLEHEPRRIYTGAVGLLSPGGGAVFNVAIRTLIVDADSGAATFNVGSGITWDSTARGEYEECCQKGRFLTDPWPEFELLETIELNAGEYSLLERHLSRARDSSLYFGFSWTDAAVRDALEAVCQLHPLGRWRVRLLVDRNGKPRTEVRRLNQTPEHPLSVKFSTCPIDDRDPLVFHKTTARARIDVELKRCHPCDDVVFWNCRGEVTESSIANIVVSTDGRNWTPPREAGLLAGTFREELISKGELFERTITKRELESLGKFQLVNSVRGWMDAELA